MSQDKSRKSNSRGLNLRQAGPVQDASKRYWYLLLVPIFILLSLVEFYPVAMGVFLSLRNPSGGLDAASYLKMVTDSAFWNSIAVSLSYSTLSTVIAVSIGLGLAFLATQEVRGRKAFEAMYIAPLAAAPIMAGILWSPSAIWDDINTFIHFILGLPYINPLDLFFFFPVMSLSEAWEWAPLIMLVSLSVMSSGEDAFEAAKVHGASNLQIFRRLALPMILRSPVTQFVIVLRFIDAMRAFEIPLAWSNWVGFQNAIGSPVDTMSLFLFKLIFVPAYGFPISLVSAIAVSLLVVTLVAATVMLRLMGRIGGR